MKVEDLIEDTMEGPISWKKFYHKFIKQKSADTLKEKTNNNWIQNNE